MKNYIQTKVRTISLLLIYTVLVVSCNNNKTESIDPNNSLNTPVKDKIYSVSGILGFSSLKIFLKFVEQNSKIDQQTRANFEDKYKYRSMLSSFENALTWNIKNQAEYDHNKGFASFENNILQINFGPSISTFVNDEGLVIIGSKLYRFLNNEIRSITMMNKLSLSECISALKGDSKYLGEVKIDPIKFVTIDSKNETTDKNARVGRGTYNAKGSTTIYSSGQYYQYSTYGSVGLSSIPITYQDCAAGLVYDEDCRCYVCAGPVVETTTWINQLTCNIRGELVLRDSGGNVISTSGNSQNVRIQGNVTIYLNGTTTPVTFNNQNTGPDYTIWPYSYNTSSSPSTLDANGSVTFTTLHTFSNNLYTSCTVNL